MSSSSSTTTKVLDKILKKGKDDAKVKSFGSMLTKLVTEKGTSDASFNDNFRTLCEVALVVSSGSSRTALLADVVTFVHGKTRRPKGRLELLSSESMKKAKSAATTTTTNAAAKTTGPIEETTSSFAGAHTRGKRARDEAVPASLILQKDGTSKTQLSNNPSGESSSSTTANPKDLAITTTKLVGSSGSEVEILHPWDVTAMELRKSGAIFDRVELEGSETAAAAAAVVRPSGAVVPPPLSGGGGHHQHLGGVDHSTIIPRVLHSLTQSSALGESLLLWRQAQHPTALIQDGHSSVSGLTINTVTGSVAGGGDVAVGGAATAGGTTSSSSIPGSAGGHKSPALHHKDYHHHHNHNHHVKGQGLFQSKSFVPAADSGSAGGRMRLQVVDKKFIQNMCQMGVVAAFYEGSRMK